MAFFNSAVGVLQTLVVALGAGLGIWGAINLLEGYGNDNPGAKAYGTKEIRTYLHDQSARYTIPPKVNTKQPWPFDKETYKRRNVIAHFFNRLKEFRRAETRYDKRDDSFLAFVMVAAICVAFGILHI